MYQTTSTSAGSKEPLPRSNNTSFNSDIIKEALKNNFSNPKTKISDDAVELMVELTKSLVVETALRTAKQSLSQNKAIVSLDHMEAALPQIMLDFP